MNEPRQGAFYSPRQLELLANRVLARYHATIAGEFRAPVEAWRLLDVVYPDQLNPPLWEPIPEPPGRTVLAALAPADRLVVLNETRRQLIEETEGLENDLVAHEIAHWELHIDRSVLGNATLPGMERPLTFTCDEGPDGSWDERNAHRFMGYLLMPSDLIMKNAEGLNLMAWPDRYRLRERFDVTITALNIRLADLGFPYVGGDGPFYHTRQEAGGQLRLI